MKKILSLILALLMIFSVTVLAEGEVTLDAAKAEFLSGATINGEILRYTKKGKS